MPADNSPRLKLGDVAHVLREDGTTHALYLNDGRVVRFSSITGDVYSVVQLPTTAEIDAIVPAPPPRQWGSSTIR